MNYLRDLARESWQFVRRERLDRLLLIISVLIALSAVFISLLEPNLSIDSALWWSIVTLTTVGYGDISPSTPGGRLVAVLIMFVGIGLLGTLSATIASVLVDRKLKEDHGLTSYDFQNHIILIEWNHRARAVLRQLRADESTAKAPVILIAELERKPVDDPDLHFVRGNPGDETLTQANVAHAKTVIVLGKDELDAAARDARVVLATLTVESMNPDAYTIVEIVDGANAQFCRRANADEIIVSNNLSSHLIARAAVNHGISTVITDMLTADQGNELYTVSLPKDFAGRRFMDLFLEMKAQHRSITIAVQQGVGGPVLANPDGDYRLSEGDLLIVVAPNRPTLVTTRRSAK